MKILLDTHVLLWVLKDSPQLPSYVRDMVADEKNEIYVSAASLWEIAIKHKKKPEIFPFSATNVRDYCQRSGFCFLSISTDSIAIFERNSFSENNDPFDQMLVSQSIANNMKLITHDYKIKEFNIGNIELF